MTAIYAGASARRTARACGNAGQRTGIAVPSANGNWVTDALNRVQQVTGAIN